MDRFLSDHPSSRPLREGDADNRRVHRENRRGLPPATTERVLEKNIQKIKEDIHQELTVVNVPIGAEMNLEEFIKGLQS